MLSLGTCDFLCGDGVCIPEEYVCDNYLDCRNGTDERGCIDLGDFENTEYPDAVPQQCPNATGLLGTCAEECSSNEDCEDDNLCCFNGCGRSCVAGTPAEPLCPALRQQSDTPLLGAFVPSCEKDGSFSQVQCHEAFCWCVDAVSGEPQSDGVGLPEQPECGGTMIHMIHTWCRIVCAYFMLLASTIQVVPIIMEGLMPLDRPSLMRMAATHGTMSYRCSFLVVLLNAANTVYF